MGPPEEGRIIANPGRESIARRVVAQEGAETGLFEVVVVGEGVGDGAAENDAVRADEGVDVEAYKAGREDYVKEGKGKPPAGAEDE
jgi:hypothetical protein